MKTAILTFIGLFACYFSFSQTQDIYKFKATLVRIASLDSLEQFEGVSEKKDVTIFIVLNYKTQKIIVYTPTQQNFDLIKVITTYTDKDTNRWNVWKALDDDGIQCIIREKIYDTGTSDGFDTVFYVDYKHSTYEYAGHRES